MTKFAKFKRDWDRTTLLKIFEIPVTDTRTGNDEYLIFDIEIRNKQLVATHEPLTREQENSKYVAQCSVDIDPDFSIDSHLQELYTECIENIMNSDFFTLNE